VAERPSVFITAPALPLRYTPEGLVGTKCIPSPNGELDEQSGKPKLVPIVVPIFELDHAAEHLFPNSTNQENFIRGSDDSLIALPPFRKLLAEACGNKRRQRAIAQKVEQAMEETYRTIVPKGDIPLPVSEPIKVTVSAPKKTTQVFNAKPPKAFSCDFDGHGVFKLRAADVRMIPRPDSYAVTACFPVHVGEPDPNQVVPQRPDAITDLSLPLAYWHTPAQGSKAAIKSLEAGVETLTLALNERQKGIFDLLPIIKQLRTHTKLSRAA
jgi:hypothetical protein